jgi:hypothetical protein
MGEDAPPSWLRINLLGLLGLAASALSLFAGLIGLTALVSSVRAGRGDEWFFGLLMLAAGTWLWSFFAAYLINALSRKVRVGPDGVTFYEGFRQCEVAARDVRNLSLCAISPQGWRYITLVDQDGPHVITNALYSDKTFDALGEQLREWAARHDKVGCVAEDIPPGALGARYRRRGRLTYATVYIVVLVSVGLVAAAIHGDGLPL